ncbi:putative glutamine amidotransferase-related [Besnoitia besnoiti]|uniref:Putative glutamine amidotransferase-related n=1 Tax=Besnoitia besnoiti TaxID=94643 RepID=A0A2A9M2V3_BESBE|nr:putative glutamine amidotransferase-related [Besnoitia besnoiti]PFH32295.1 putative glutamine amidotransferase-related [Besnoitia besnoiti]
MMSGSGSNAQVPRREATTDAVGTSKPLKPPLFVCGEPLSDREAASSPEDLVRVLVVTRRWLRKGRLTEYVSQLHLEMLQSQHAVPVMVPRTPWTRAMLEGFMPMHGLLLVEGEDIGPSLDPYRGTASVDQVQRLEVQSMHPGEVTSDEERDAIEVELLQRCHANGVPILGICRGCQLINVFRGGSLFYDIGLQVGKGVQHINYSNYDQHRHGLWVNSVSPLGGLFREEYEKARSTGALLSAEDVRLRKLDSDGFIVSGSGGPAVVSGQRDGVTRGGVVNESDTTNRGGDDSTGVLAERRENLNCFGPQSGNDFFQVQVNSYHHQGVRDLGKGLIPVAFSEDGLIEAYCDASMMVDENGSAATGGAEQRAIDYGHDRRPCKHFVLGLQFHPERMADDYAGCRRIFEAFVTACRRYKRACSSSETLSVSRAKV